MAREAEAAGKGSVGNSGRLLLVAAVTLILAATALPMSVLFAAGMLPSAVAATVDRHRLRYLTLSVTLLNLAGMVIPVMSLLKLPMTLAAALRILSDPRNLLIMYSAAGIGWILYLSMPVLARMIIDFRAERYEHRLMRRAEALVAEWGPDLKGH